MCRYSDYRDSFFLGRLSNLGSELKSRWSESLVLDGPDRAKQTGSLVAY